LVKPVAGWVAHAWRISVAHQQDMLTIGQILKQSSAGGLSARHEQTQTHQHEMAGSEPRRYNKDFFMHDASSKFT
jgi:hypothetical protein